MFVFCSTREDLDYSTSFVRVSRRHIAHFPLIPTFNQCLFRPHQVKFALTIILPRCADNLMVFLREDSGCPNFTLAVYGLIVLFAFSTVWIYLFFLPFQLIDQFAWSTIPGVGIASFIYLGLISMPSFFNVEFDTHFSMTGFLAGLVPISSRARGSIILILYSPPSQPEKRSNNRLVSQSYCGRFSACLWVRFTLTLFLGYDEVRVSGLNRSPCLLLLSDIRMILTWTSSAKKLSIKILMGSKGHPA